MGCPCVLSDYSIRRKSGQGINHGCCFGDTEKDLAMVVNREETIAEELRVLRHVKH